MKKLRCTVCGYVHEGDAAPEKCPLCKAPASKFVEVVEVEGGALSLRFCRLVLVSHTQSPNSSANLAACSASSQA